MFVNTLFDHEPTAIDGEAQCMRRWLEQLLPHNPIILIGDFNTARDSEAYRLLTAERALVDIYRYASIRTNRMWLLSMFRPLRGR